MSLELLEKQLLKLLKDNDFTDITLDEILKSYNIRLTVAYDLSCKVLGFVYYSRRGNYHLVINGNVNSIMQRKTFIHEIKHIINDMPKAGFIIGLDMKYALLELEADKVAEAIAKYM